MTGWIGITLGDLAGVGAEVALKALSILTSPNTASEKGGAGGALPARYLLLGNLELALQLNQRLNLPLAIAPYDSFTRESAGRIFVLDPFSEALPKTLPPGSPALARAALAYLQEGAQRCLRGELDALVTAPVNKESILKSGRPFVGQTEFLSELAKTDRTAMMLLGEDDRGRWLRVVLATTHLPLKLVPEKLSQGVIEQAIELAALACAQLRLGARRIGVCGLNPHAGEGGELGREEMEMITPAVQATRQRGLSVSGPLAADTLFYQAYRGEYEAVVAMYHDQGLAPLKMVAFENGVNWTVGLPFIRTSPDHGTAYDIAGRGLANPSSMIAAINLAKSLAESQAISQTRVASGSSPS